MKLQAVVGANYGDEGKGLVTDYLSTPKSLVVRFNGGAQAGHTVVSKVHSPTMRHVFHHIGSGTFQRADTFLSQFFLVNPLQFFDEHLILDKMGFHNKVIVDPRCNITTPIDMMINQALEDSREQRHGSCGLGINETVHRSLHDSAFGFTVENAMGGDNTGQRIRWRLERLRDEYLPLRLKELGLKSLLPNATKNMDQVLDWFIFKIGYFLGACEVADFETVSKAGYEKIVFEGAQGLRLDQNSENFPHVTRSNTGLTNVWALLKEAKLPAEDLEAFFVTRTYVTKHGDGPFLYEVDKPPYPGIVDETNVPNPWQGTIRYGLFDPLKMGQRFSDQVGINRKFNVVLTCVDQLGSSPMRVANRGGEFTMTLSGFDDLMWSFGAKQLFISNGPSRDSISALPVRT